MASTVYSNGETIVYSYVPDSTDSWSTVTYVTEETGANDWVTYISVPTQDGIATYTESLSTVKTAHGTLSYVDETTSLGSTEVITYSTV